MRELRPQKGPQEQFLSSPADIIIYGGSAGGGKSWSLLYEPLRHVNNPRFNCVIFRRTMAQVMNSGSIWDASFGIYNLYPGARPVKTPRPNWRFPSGANIMFAHMQDESTKMDYQGAEICLIEYDELCHFTEGQFWYLLSRNRSTCGVKPYIRATCNPDPDSFVAKLISWWWDPKTGYAIPERSGVIRFFARVNEELVWGDTREEILEQPGVMETYESTKKNFEEMGASYDLDNFILSFTFIASSVYDNQELLKQNPMYLTNLQALGLVERERLLKGNWLIRPAAGLLFKRIQATVVDEIPEDVSKWVRGWDLAATEKDENGEAAFTAGVLIGKRKNGKYIVADVVNKQYSADEVRKLILNTSRTDKKQFKHRVKVRLPQDPGQAGKDQAANFIKMLAGFSVAVERESGDKVTRAEPFAAQWQAGNVEILAGEWNEMYFNQLEAFPDGKWKDMVDASSSAFAELEKANVSSAPPQETGNVKSSYWR